MLLLHALLRALIKKGTLKVIDASGRTHRFGDSTQPSVTIRFHNAQSQRRIALNPMLALGEAFMDGTMTVEEGDIYDFLALAMSNIGTGHGPWLQELLTSLRRFGRRFAQYNPIGRAQANVAHHYDLSDKLYELFLDKDRQYSCAYFEHPSDSLEQAQENKKRHIAAKLRLESGQRLLDIGSGWGGLGLYLAKISGADVTGVTLSIEQQKVSQQRAQSQGLASKVHFELKD